jgi:hypothetical protein
MKGDVMSFKNILKYIKNLFNTDNKLKPLTFTVIIKNIKIDPKVLKRYDKDEWKAEADFLTDFEYTGYFSYSKSNKNKTAAQLKDWCLNEFKARYSVPDGLIIDWDCEVYLNYATLKDWKAYCDNNDIELPLKTIDKRIF